MRIGAFDVSPEAVEMVPESVARENDVLPLRYSPRRLEVAMPDARDGNHELLAKLAFILNAEIVPHFADAAVVRDAVDAAYSLPWTRVSKCHARITQPCDRRWLELTETASSDRRLCLACDKLVHLCRTADDAARHAGLGHCVALLTRSETESVESMGLIEFVADESAG